MRLTFTVMDLNKFNSKVVDVCVLLFLLVGASKCYGQSHDRVQVQEGEECEGADGITGVCTLPEICSSQKYGVIMLTSCSVSSGSRVICCPITKNPKSFRRRRYTWKRAPHSQTQQPIWHYSDNNDYTRQTYYNGYQNPHNGYNNQHWHGSNYNGYSHQNYDTGLNDDHPINNNYNNGHNHQNGHDNCDHDHAEQNRHTSDSNQNKHENNNQNLKEVYTGQYIQNSNIGNRDSNLQNVKTTQNPVSLNSMSNSANGSQGHTPLSISQTPGVTMQEPGNQIEDTTSVPFTTRTPYVEPNPVPSALSGIRISERKCVEYMEHMKNLAEKYTVVEKSRCAWHENRNITRPAYHAIYLGRNATVAEFPHMVALGWPLIEGGFDYKCGGTLISESFILTAGHCLSAPDRDNTISSLVPTIVRLGDFIIDDAIPDGTNPITREVKRTIKHPKYMPPTKYFDLGLVEMAQKVELTLEIRPACLWTDPDFGSYRYAVVSGWGKVSFTGRRADILQQASLELFENPFCAPLLESVRDRNWKTGLADSQLCAGDLINGTDTCQGDSGSALAVAYKNNQCLFFVMGVTSFGRPCGTLNSPGIYTRVSSFVDWIESVVWNDAIDDVVFG